MGGFGRMLLHSRVVKALPVASPLATTRLFSHRAISSRLFVGGLSYDTNETILMDAFGEYGKIIEVKVICDRWSGKSKGFGFIQFSSESEATKALKEMNGQFLEGRNIRVFYYKSKE